MSIHIDNIKYDKFYIKHPKKRLVLGMCGTAHKWKHLNEEGLLDYIDKSAALQAVQRFKLSPSEFRIIKGDEFGYQRNN